jgi:small subunit ribosomal protein S6
MPLYEHVFLVRQDVSPQQVDALTETYKALIAENGGEVGKTEYWGLKSLAYRVKKNRKGHYTLMNIEAPSAAVAEMERQMGLSDDVIRFLTLKVDELEAGPSAMVRSRGRDDRRGGRDRGDRDRGDRDRGDRGDRDRGDRGDRDRGERRRRDEDTPAAAPAAAAETGASTEETAE